MLTHPHFWIFSSSLGPGACCMQCGACLYSNNARCHQMPQFAPKNSFSGRPLSPLSIRGGHPLLLPLLHLCSAPGPLAQCCFTIITFWGKPLYIYFFHIISSSAAEGGSGGEVIRHTAGLSRTAADTGNDELSMYSLASEHVGKPPVELSPIHDGEQWAESVQISRM